MMGYAQYKDDCIRVHAQGYDVLVGDKPSTRFVTFKTKPEAEQFIDGGRVVAGHVVRDVNTLEIVKA